MIASSLISFENKTTDKFWKPRQILHILKYLFESIIRKI